MYDIKDGWAVGVVESGDEVLFIRANRAVADRAPLPDFPFRLNVRVALNAPTDQGLPTNAEAQELGIIEDHIVSSVAVPRRARLCAVVTSTAARRDYLLHAADRSWMKQWADEMRAAVSSHGLQIGVAEDREWSVIRSLSEQAMAAVRDEQALGVLTENGVDLSSPREIHYFMYFTTETNAREAAEVLEEHEYRVDRVPTTDGRWRVIASHDERPTSGVIRHMRAMLGAFCENHGGDFDGWEVAVRP